MSASPMWPTWPSSTTPRQLHPPEWGAGRGAENFPQRQFQRRSVSDGCLNAFKELQAQYSDLHVVVLSNQGNYITIIVNSIISSMLVGAALAIIVLAIFLKDIKPTLVVGVSIPLSVLFAVVLMYFTGLDMNIMTLAGLSLGVGMLVDNSVVVIENIYRLRAGA